jgi:hypothetical protein
VKHELKLLPCYYEASIIEGDKLFEIRDNTDRGFQKGDTVVFNEVFSPSGGYTGRFATVIITYVTNYRQKPGYVVFGFLPENEWRSA